MKCCGCMLFSLLTIPLLCLARRSVILYSVYTWPENSSDFSRFTTDHWLEFYRIRTKHLSAEDLNHFTKLEGLAFLSGRIDKAYVKPSLKEFALTATGTSEILINVADDYQLVDLEVSGCKLKALPRNVGRLSRLQSLDLSRNQIEFVEMDILNSLNMLQVLVISSNQIRTVSTNYEISLPKLTGLDFSYNDLSDLNICSWNLPHLRKISLAGNNLSYVVDILQKLPIVDYILLVKNPLHCGWLKMITEEIDNADRDINFIGACSKSKTNLTFIEGCSAKQLPFQCGLRQRRNVELIVHGHDATRGDWPWHVAVYHKLAEESLYACGGTLISSTFILTASHCVIDSSTRNKLLTEQILVKLGVFDLNNVDPESQERSVQEIFKFENFSRLVDDIALLRLTEPAELNSCVHPVCVDRQGDFVGEYGTAVGWGLRSDDSVSSILQSAPMPVISTLPCLMSSRSFFANTLNYGVFCAGYSNGTSVCNGDSGGGLFFQRNNIWFVGGIISFSESRPGSDGLCRTDGYGGFVNVSYYGSWIQRITDL
ncbi:plasminogen-like isoform X2 [Ochlerotatus camptorhynchus]|uniref:plasminogen-like isoform X2 n=1 Tax=Ochlerotatus camptorhynchus TaxID=644619 RepID=UPI0031D02B32